MLTHIHIRDLATIESLHLSLSSGNTMITGETGAGKSIFIEAIELALGGRASPNLIRSGKEKAEISLCFDVSHFPKVMAYLKQNDLEVELHECIIRRVISTDGRSRCYVNGTPSTVQHIKELGELLFHLHGQHEQQVLLKADHQREMLDRFADHLPLAQAVKNLSEEYKSVTQQIKKLHEQSHTRTERADYLRFQLEELQAEGLQPGEWQALEQEHHRLTHAETLLSTIQMVINDIAEDENKNALTRLYHARKNLEAIQAMEQKGAEWINALNSAIIPLADLASDLKNYLENTTVDPAKLQKIESRVSDIFNLARKHKMNPEALPEFQLQLEAELQSLASTDDNLAALLQKQTDIEKQYQQLAIQLSSQRKDASEKFENEITMTMRGLSLPHGKFKVMLEPDTSPLAPHGQEKIIFQIKTNPDQTLQALAKVISGGELSRLSLAAHLALANRTTIPVLVFDEVDTGLSGATAEKIGKLLRKLGESYQVFCVTHQPQVAACGHHHLLVEKYFIESSTHTRLRLLDTTEKTTEIARMLGGEKITPTTLKHAKEVLDSMTL